MRIVHISTRLILGGSQENTVLSCEGQLRLGHEVHLAFGPIYGPEGSMLDRVEHFRVDVGEGGEGGEGGEARITTHELPNMVRELSLMKDFRAYRECRRLIRAVRPDIVHTHSSKAGIVGRAAAWAEGGKRGTIGVVHTIHGLPFHPCEKRWRNAIYIWSERWAAKRCHRIVTVCDAMRDQAVRAGVGKHEQYQTVYSGMEIERYLKPHISREAMRERLGFQSDDFVIGTVARLAELKGHDDLIDSLADGMGDHPNWKMLWVGDGWWRDRLVKRLDAEGIGGRVVLAGLVPTEEVGDYIAAMDVLVHPSYREGLPRTVPQALLGGVPVVAYDVDGAAEVCRNEETGLLVRPGDCRGLGKAVEWMSAHREERVRMTERGRAACMVRFDSRKMVSDLEQVYQQVLEGLEERGCGGK